MRLGYVWSQQRRKRATCVGQTKPRWVCSTPGHRTALVGAAYRVLAMQQRWRVTTQIVGAALRR